MTENSSKTPAHIRLPHTFLDDPLWIDTPPAQKEVFITVLRHACFLPQKFDDHGHMIDLMPGQFCASIREILKLCGKWISKKNIEDSLQRFKKYRFWGHEVRHKKTLITFTDLRILESLKFYEETTKGTNWGQTGDTKEIYNNKLYVNTKLKKKENIINIAQTASQPRKEIYFSFENRKFENVEETDKAAWRLLYPSCDITHEFRGMVEWCLQNPTKAKSRTQWRKFIGGWLKKANNDAISKNAYSKAPARIIPIQEPALPEWRPNV